MIEFDRQIKNLEPITYSKNKTKTYEKIFENKSSGVFKE